MVQVKLYGKTRDGKQTKSVTNSEKNNERKRERYKSDASYIILNKMPITHSR